MTFRQRIKAHRSQFRFASPGTLTSVTNFASSVSRNMDRLSLDSDHRQRQEMARRRRPLGVGEGLRNGLAGLGLSMLGTATDRVTLGALAYPGITPQVTPPNYCQIICKLLIKCNCIGGSTTGLRCWCANLFLQNNDLNNIDAFSVDTHFLRVIQF